MCVVGLFSKSTMGTRKMEILIAITLVLVSGSSVSAYSPTQITTIYPINFMERTKEAYVYTSIVLETYVEPFILTEDNIRELIDEAFTSPVRCNDTDDDNCKYINEAMPTFQDTVRKLAHQELRSVLFEMRHNINGFKRNKRGVGRILGKILHNWCDVALQDDITDLLDRDDRRRTQISAILESIKSQREVAKNCSLNLGEKLEDMKKQLAMFADDTAVRSLLRNQITQLIFHYDKIHDSCNRRVIPSNTIDLDTLSKDLQKKESILELLDLTLAIPLDSIDDYYKLRICSCTFSDKGINMTLHIPVKPMNARYELFSPIYLPFKFGKQICSIQAQDAILINDTNSGRMQVSTAQYLKNCDLATHLCKLHSVHNPNINSLCLQETFLEKDIAQLRELCPFVCTPIPVDKPLINQLKDDEYVITNVPDDTYVEYNNETLVPLLNTNQDGALRLKLPCFAKLVRFSNSDTTFRDTLIDYVSPCQVNFTEMYHMLEPVMPLQWLGNATLFTTNLNSEWKKFTPAYSIMPESELNARLSAIAELNTTPQRTPRDTGIFGFFFDLLPDELNNNVYLLSTYFCNLFVAFLLCYRIRSMRRRLRRVETGLISRGGGGGGVTLLPLHHQPYETTSRPHHQKYETTFRL